VTVDAIGDGMGASVYLDDWDGPRIVNDMPMIAIVIATVKIGQSLLGSPLVISRSSTCRARHQVMISLPQPTLVP
jgi:hypothetical protein